MATNPESVLRESPSLVRWWPAQRPCAACLLFLLAGTLSAANMDDAARWWDDHWRMRVSLTVGVGSYERQDKPIERFLNFKTLLAGLGRGGETCLPESLRVLETDANRVVIDEEVPFQFDPLTPDSGTLVLLLTGATPVQGKRYYDLYFDTAGAFAPAVVEPLLEVTDEAPDEEQLCYRIAAANATYYFQKDAGGFSSLLDRDGNDWISFHPFGGSDGIYRGIPNLVHPDNIYHPGHRNCTSTLDHVGPLRATIRSVSKDGLWECLWHIYPYHARLTVLRSASKAYWFLYEGTPGGAIDYETDFSVRSNGTRLPASQSWQDQDISAPEWVYFEDSTLDRYIYLVHEEDDASNDTFWPMEGNMTVFGFGRGPGTSKHMTAIPNHFTIGLANGAEFASANKVIEGSYRPVTVTVGLAEEKPGVEGDWRFDEGEGPVAQDLSVYGRHALLRGMAWDPAGRVGSALQFDGLGGYVEVPGYRGVLGTSARTIALWVDVPIREDMDLISWGQNVPGRSWSLSIMRGGGRGQRTGAIQVSVTEGSLTGSTQLTDGQWHHVAAVLPPSASPRAQDIQLYVDGRTELASQVMDCPVHTTAGDNVRFGARAGDSRSPFHGLLDEVRIYSRTLRPEEIAELAGITE